MAFVEQVHQSLVLFPLLVPQLVHAADDGHGPVHRRKRGYGGGHGGGVGVVAVEVEAVAAGGFAVLGALVGGDVGLDGLFDVERLDAEVETHGDGGHAVVEVVVAQEVGVDVIDVVAHLEVEVEVGVEWLSG